jgi:hypothetical protein
MILKRILLESLFVLWFWITVTNGLSSSYFKTTTTPDETMNGITPMSEPPMVKTTAIILGVSLKIDDSSSKLFNDIEYLLILFKRVIKNINHTTIRIYIESLLTIVHRAIENSEIYEHDVVKIQNLFDSINEQISITVIFYGKYAIPQLQDAITQVKKTFKCSESSFYSSFQPIYFKFENFSHTLSDKINDLVKK